MTWWDGVPAEYERHLPGPGPTHRETLKGLGQRGLEEGIEPFLEVGQGVKESLKRVYAVAAQPLGGEVIKPKPFDEAPFEFMASLAGYIAALPIKVMGDLVEKSGRLRKEAAQTLLGGPRGEGGEWTEEQVDMSMLATELTLGAMVGGGPGAGTGPANIALRSSGKGAKRVVGALERLAQEYQVRAKPLQQLVELSAKPGARKNLSRKLVSFIHGQKLGELTQMKRNYPTVTKGLRAIPQEALDLVGDIGLAPKAERGIAGRFRPKKSRAEYQIVSEVAVPKETIPHEIFHATQIAKLKAKRIKRIRPEVLEAQTYEFEPLFMREVAKLPKGAKMSMETWNRLYDESFANMLTKYGTDFSKYKMSDIVGKGHLARKGELQSVASIDPTDILGKKLYHGSSSLFKSSKDMPKGHRGYFATTSEKLAKRFGSNIHEVVLKTKKIFDGTNKVHQDLFINAYTKMRPKSMYGSTTRLRERLKRGDYGLYEDHYAKYALEDLGFKGNIQKEQGKDVVRLFSRKSFDFKGIKELKNLAEPPRTIGAKLAEFTRKGEAKMPKLSQEDKALRDITKASMGRFLREQGLIAKEKVPEFRLIRHDWPDIFGTGAGEKAGIIEQYSPKSKTWKEVTGRSIGTKSETAWEVAHRKLREFEAISKGTVVKFPTKEPKAIGKLKNILEDY